MNESAKQRSVKISAISSSEFLFFFPPESLRNAKGGRGKWRKEGGGWVGRLVGWLVERRRFTTSATGIHALN